MANIIDQLEISGITYDIVDASAQAALPGKQDTLVSGVNIKTINNESLLGSGNIDIQGGAGDAYTKAETDALLATKADTSAMTEDIEAAVSGKADTSAVTAAIDAAVSGKANSSDVYLKSETSSSTEINNALQAKADASTTYTKAETDNAINAATSGKANSSDVYLKTETSSSTEINNALEAKADASTTYSKTETDNAINAATSGKADTSAVTAETQRAMAAEQALSGAISSNTGAYALDFYDIYDEQITVDDALWNDMVEAYEAGKPFITPASDGSIYPIYVDYSAADNNFYLQIIWDRGFEWINLTRAGEVGEYVYEVESGEQWINLDDKADTTAVTAAINAATSGKADTTAVTAAIDAATSGKQDTLVSGTNIKTINNESLLGSGNITIQGGGANVVELTQAQYDALVVKDPDTFYIISDAVEIDANNFYLKTQTSSSTQIAAALQTKADAATTSSATQISDALADKQNVLTAGTGIDITNDVISVTGGGGGGSYTAGRGIDITNNEISLTVPVYSKGSFNSCVSIGSDNISSIGNYIYDSLVGGYYCGIENADSSVGAGMIAMGYQVNTKNGAEAAVGKHNATTSGSTTFGDSGNTLFTVGNGHEFNERHNAFEVRANGDIYFPDTNDTTYQNFYEKPMLKLQDVLADKQDTLIPGTGISITNNVISVTGGGGGGGKAVSAGTNISITTGDTADTINCTLPITKTGNYQSIQIGTGASNVYGDRCLVMGNSINANFADTVGFGKTVTLGATTSYAMGFNIKTSNEGQFTCGYYNTSAKESNTRGSSGNTLFCVGNGYYRYPIDGYHNALEIRQNGDIYYADTNNTTYQNYYEKPMIKLQDKFDEIDTIIGDINTILSSL